MIDLLELYEVGILRQVSLHLDHYWYPEKRVNITWLQLNEKEDSHKDDFRESDFMHLGRDRLHSKAQSHVGTYIMHSFRCLFWCFNCRIIFWELQLRRHWRKYCFHKFYTALDKKYIFIASILIFFFSS